MIERQRRGAARFHLAQQLLLEFGVAVEAEPRDEADDRRPADAGALGERCHRLEAGEHAARRQFARHFLLGRRDIGRDRLQTLGDGVKLGIGGHE